MNECSFVDIIDRKHRNGLHTVCKKYTPIHFEFFLSSTFTVFCFVFVFCIKILLLMYFFSLMVIERNLSRFPKMHGNKDRFNFHSLMLTQDKKKTHKLSFNTCDVQHTVLEFNPKKWSIVYIAAKDKLARTVEGHQQSHLKQVVLKKKKTLRNWNCHCEVLPSSCTLLSGINEKTNRLTTRSCW